jgi:hypothetical protein
MCGGEKPKKKAPQEETDDPLCEHAIYAHIINHTHDTRHTHTRRTLDVLRVDELCSALCLLLWWKKYEQWRGVDEWL